ncbi:uncharacterized protein SAPINGB_P001510 [Magnusiomyces paraingens]|uniref:Karyogamy protein KAR4 n=1 Tax=Magnusiomyces paraingens TaxID=2606893 RepID=A0A5E8B871_9ASCO|nr:uncharacterized protein SAPINGB_P001510 [Saprochaete ingens]VVT47033.1 unnamed protein product [Saprochaete ingens]
MLNTEGGFRSTDTPVSRESLATSRSSGQTLHSSSSSGSSIGSVGSSSSTVGNGVKKQQYPTAPASGLSASKYNTSFKDTSQFGAQRSQINHVHFQKSTPVHSSASYFSNFNEPVDTKKIQLFNNFGNDYSDHYLRTGVLPQVHVQNSDMPLVGYPRLQRLHELKATHTLHHACTPYCASMPVPDMPSTLQKWAAHDGLIFDVVMVGGCYPYAPSLSTLASLPIPQLTPRPSIALIWVPGYGLDTARQALEAWGFRRSEDIVFMCRSRESVYYPPQHEDDIIEKSTWHCLLGLKGTLRRSEDTDLINCNVDTDIIVETLKERACIVPEQMYSIIENFTLMSRRIHIIPGYAGSSLPVRPRPGWVIVSPEAPANNFLPQTYLNEMRVLGHRVPVDPEIDLLRPKTPPRAKRGVSMK